MKPGIVLIDGEGASGKMVLRSLLDSHAELVVSPIHDMIVDSLLDYPSTDHWLEHRDSVYLRRLLAHSQYFDLERFHFSGHIPFPMAAREMASIPLDFDFYSFDSTWPSRLMQQKHWTLTRLVDHIFSCLGEYLGVPSDSSIRAWVSVGFDKATTRSSFLARYPTAQLIYMRRNVEDILAARVARKPIVGEATSESTPQLDTFLREGKIARIIQRQTWAEQTAQLYPDRVLVVDFDALVERTEETMQRVATFLNIAYAPTLAVSTVMGREILSQSGTKYVGRVLDRGKDLFTKAELAQIALAHGPLPLSALLCYPPDIVLKAASLSLYRKERNIRSAIAHIIEKTSK